MSVEAPDIPKSALSSRRHKLIKSLVKTFYSIQDTRIRTSHRMKALARTGLINPEQYENYTEITVSDLKRVEQKVKTRVEKFAKQHPLWNIWLKDVHGCGALIAGALLSDIEGRFMCLECDAKQILPPDYRCESCNHLWTPDRPGPDKLGKPTKLKIPKQCPKCNKKSVVRRDPDELTPCPNCGGDTVTFDYQNRGQIYARAGLATEWETTGRAKRRKRNVSKAQGENNWSPFLKTLLMGKLGPSFLRSGSRYRVLYDRYRQRITEQNKGDLVCLNNKCSTTVIRNAGNEREAIVIHDNYCCPGCKHAAIFSERHRHVMSTRYMIKIFLSHLYEVYKSKIHGMEVEPPYAIDNLPNHSHIIHWRDFMGPVDDDYKSPEWSAEDDEE